MFQIKSLLISFFNYHNFINMSSLINLSFISITFLYFLFCDFNYNIFQDIYCDGINDDQILDLNNRHIENSDNS
jgi:hypothetical protein